MAQRGRPKKTATSEINKDVENLKPYVDAIVSNKMNYKSTIYSKYLECCNIESDINQLLPYIFDIVASIPDCHCTEFGVRIPTSTYAFLAAKPKCLVSYDISRYHQVDEVEKLCMEEGQDFQFVLASTVEIEIEETDIIFFDTLHSKKMLETELALHADKSRHFLVFHDVFGPYWEVGEAPYNDETSPYGGGLGIRYAIEPFLENICQI